MVFIIIITYNARDFIGLCLESLARQTYRNFHILVVDNASTDDTRKIVMEYPTVSTIANRNNLGFCRANNQGLTLALENNTNVRPEFVMLVNQDTLLDSSALEELVQASRLHPEAGVFGPKTLRFHFERGQDEEQHAVLTPIIDSTGIYPQKSFQFISRGEGQKDKGQFGEGEVWGFSGSCMMVRSKVWEALKVKTREYLDEDLFMYKDDVDLGFRLHRLGILSYFVPRALVYHYRSAPGVTAELTGWNFFNNLRVALRKKKDLITFWGYRNQLLVLYKNLTASQWLGHSVFIFWFEFRKLVYFLLTQPLMLLRAWKDVFRLKKTMKLKREIMNEIEI